MDGSKVTLHLAGARIETCVPRYARIARLAGQPQHCPAVSSGRRAADLSRIQTPPGTIVPGALGTLMVLLAIFALGLLPIRFTSVLLLVAALVLLLLEASLAPMARWPSPASSASPSERLHWFAAPVQEMAISPWVALAVSAAFRQHHRLPGST